MDKRLIYRVVIKFLFLIAIGLLAIVLFNSLFLGANSGDGLDQDSKDGVSKTAVKLIEIDLENMLKGDIKKAHWEGREVNIINLGDDKYFTYFNVGDSGNCPLFKEAASLKDICTGTRFDFSGSQKGNGQGYKLTSPPHYIEGNRLLIGQWKNKSAILSK